LLSRRKIKEKCDWNLQHFLELAQIKKRKEKKNHYEATEDAASGPAEFIHNILKG